jgi:hypothetical protein
MARANRLHLLVEGAAQHVLNILDVEAIALSSVTL